MDFVPRLRVRSTPPDWLSDTIPESFSSPRSQDPVGLSVGALGLLEVIEAVDLSWVRIDDRIRRPERAIALLAHGYVLLAGRGHLRRSVLLTVLRNRLVVMIVVIMSVIIVLLFITKLRRLVQLLKILLVYIVVSPLVPVYQHALRLNAALLNHVLHVPVFVRLQLLAGFVAREQGSLDLVRGRRVDIARMLLKIRIALGVDVAQRRLSNLYRDILVAAFVQVARGRIVILCCLRIVVALSVLNQFVKASFAFLFKFL